MNRKIILFLPILVLIISCISKPVEVVISNISETEKIIIQHSDTTKSIFSISIIISGYIDGDARIIINDGFGFYKDYKINKGDVMININDDWYSTKCILEYIPENVSKGNLKISYEFFEI